MQIGKGRIVLCTLVDNKRQGSVRTRIKSVESDEKANRIGVDNDYIHPSNGPMGPYVIPRYYVDKGLQ